MSVSVYEPDRIKEQFDKVGYCVVEGIYSAEELQDIEEFFDAYLRTDAPVLESGRGQHAERATLSALDVANSLVRVLHPHRLDDRVLDWYLHPNVASTLEVLFGRPALGAQTMFYYKPPGGRGQGMHQDNFYLLARPATCIGMWTPLDDAEVENGCLWVSPGSNHDDMHCPDGSRAERWMNYGDSHISHFPRDRKPVPCPVMRGQTLFFSGNLIHGSGPNRHPTRWRRTFIGHYVDEATEMISKFYHPLLDMEGRTVSHVEEYRGGGPCGEEWKGGTH